MGDDRYDSPRVPVTLDLNARPTLWRLARLGFDSVRQRPVLLYPEGAVLLNDTGAAILELVDGRRTVGEIAAILGERYHTDVTADVAEYIAVLAEKELIRDV
jgi:pyrroloquinoline quinone biosynthesis protein D